MNRPIQLPERTAPRNEPINLSYGLKRRDGTRYAATDWAVFVDVFEATAPHDRRSVERLDRITLTLGPVPGLEGDRWNGLLLTNRAEFVRGSVWLLRVIRKHLTTGYEYTDVVESIKIL